MIHMQISQTPAIHHATHDACLFPFLQASCQVSAVIISENLLWLLCYDVLKFCLKLTELLYFPWHGGQSINVYIFRVLTSLCFIDVVINTLGHDSFDKKQDKMTFWSQKKQRDHSRITAFSFSIKYAEVLFKKKPRHLLKKRAKENIRQKDAAHTNQVYYTEGNILRFWSRQGQMNF